MKGTFEILKNNGLGSYTAEVAGVKYIVRKVAGVWRAYPSGKMTAKWSARTLAELDEILKGNINEEMSAGGGNVAGIGIGPQGEPGVNLPKPIIRRKFAGNEVFEVTSDKYQNCVRGKNRYHAFESYVGDDPAGIAIKDYANQNKGKPIIVQCEKTGAMSYIRYGRRR